MTVMCALQPPEMYHIVQKKTNEICKNMSACLRFHFEIKCSFSCIQLVIAITRKLLMFGNFSLQNLQWMNGAGSG